MTDIMGLLSGMTVNLRNSAERVAQDVPALEAFLRAESPDRLDAMTRSTMSVSSPASGFPSFTDYVVRRGLSAGADLIGDVVGNATRELIGGTDSARLSRSLDDGTLLGLPSIYNRTYRGELDAISAAATGYDPVFDRLKDLDGKGATLQDMYLQDILNNPNIPQGEKDRAKRKAMLDKALEELSEALARLDKLHQMAMNTIQSMKA